MTIAVRVVGRSLLLALATLLLGRGAHAADAAYKLTYDKPAAEWNEALPLGNGRIGVMDFGGTAGGAPADQ